ncbi:CU044_5270 family protein [Nonomuraea sp. NEAU-A123]|uniref:CU044_5270 family protein n=1 Tax=Nonomuraea sp. NEAU-A123 TaxID=2839649 RepID=UPI001BE4C40E|nr:CU044_5270 family protein [Nonomuraea sp. NEAU-A123]MBT2234600.1 CU044_5270 family protein [Nonomuraea sp. NEAU-A123]
MKEFQLIDDVMPDVPPTDHARVMAVRARMLNEAPRRRLPGWSRVTLAAASVALVLVGGFVVAPGLGGGPAPGAAPEDAAQVLATAADRLAAQPPGEGAWWRREEVQVLRIKPKDNSTFTVEQRVTQVLWINREGKEQREQGDVSAAPLTPADEQAWKDAGKPALCDAGAGECAVGKVFHIPMDPKTYKPVTRLPTDAETLKAKLLKGFPADGSGGESRESWLWMAARWLLVDAETTPGTRAALYRMLAGLPEVRVIDGVADLDGRVGVGLVFEGNPVRQWSGQYLPVQQQIVIDRESGDLLAVQGALIQPHGSQSGEPFESYVIKKQGWTDEAPIR